MPGKVMERWVPQAVSFMEDAAAYGTYHRDLARALEPYLPRDGHVCDAGCGLGHLAYALAEYCREVTAVDLSAAALEPLRKKAAARPNLHIRCGDLFSMEEIYDAMVFCYFGHVRQILAVARDRCRGNVIVARRNCDVHRFSMGHVPIGRRENMEQALRDLGVPCEKHFLSLELGQPFRSAEDAIAFFTLYNRSSVPVSEEAALSRLVRTEDPAFPLYLPSRRDMEILVFSGRDIPKELSL